MKSNRLKLKRFFAPASLQFQLLSRALFDRFYRIESSRARINGGAGLGLSITKSIVDISKGTIHIESKEGEGSTIRIRLPRMV